MIPHLAVGWIHPGENSATFTASLIDLMVYEMVREGRPPFYLANRCSSGRIPEGRNQLAVKFLATEAPWLLMVDADMGFAPDTAERLIAAADPVHRPIVGALCFAQRREAPDPSTHAERFSWVPTIYQYAETDDEVGFMPIFDYPRDDLALVGATGAACVLIHRDALLTIQRQFGDRWFDMITVEKGPTTFSEDMSFYIRAAACDLPVHVDTSVKTCHDKGGVYGDEWIYDRQRQLAELERPSDAALAAV